MMMDSQDKALIEEQNVEQSAEQSAVETVEDAAEETVVEAVEETAEETTVERKLYYPPVPWLENIPNEEHENQSL